MNDEYIVSEFQSINEILKKVLQKNVKFWSDSCEFFPEFNVTGKVVNWYKSNSNNELVLEVIRKPDKRKVKIGINMKGLRFKLL